MPASHNSRNEHRQNNNRRRNNPLQDLGRLL
jgi:hypothetical protein